MTYVEALAYRDKLEAALSDGFGTTISVSIGDGRSRTYETSSEVRRSLNQLNRDIKAFERKSANRNPCIMRAKWVR